MIKKLLRVLLVLFLLLNVFTIFHAWRFTHYVSEKTNGPKGVNMSFWQTVSALFTGVKRSRPVNGHFPSAAYKNKLLHTAEGGYIHEWVIETPSPKGTVLMFPGYSAPKSSLLSASDILNHMGYRTILVDFRGSGNASGNTTSIGWYEAEDVNTAFNAAEKDKPVYLFGSSMGAAAILRAVYKYHIQPSGLMLECPYNTMLATTRHRFSAMGVPAFPAAHLLVFWGGLMNGFWGFGLNPEEYAKEVKMPALLMQGAKDPFVYQDESKAIYDNLAGVKQYKLFPEATHEFYANRFAGEWEETVKTFLEKCKE